ncbi:MAG TPA: transposase [Chthonomonadaceae bacterium]|nr:transposase [Chthonomonadaceae bacterium]
MKVTLRLKLHVDPATQSALRATLEQSTACFNVVCRYGWDNNERNGTRLHQATYKPLRKAHPDLPSQLIVSARMKAAEALKSVAERTKQGRKANCPQSELCPVRYDARSYWVRLADGCASLATTQGRVCVAFRLCDYYTRYADWKPCSAALCFRGGAFYLHVVVEADAPEPVCEGVLGVDLGIVELATDSDGNSYSGEAVKAVRRRVKRIRRLLQSKGTRSAKRHWKRIRAKQSRFVNNTNHVVSQSLVRTASHSRKALALEELGNIRDRADTVSRDAERRCVAPSYAKQMRWLLGNWAFLQLRPFVAYKAEAAGIPVVLVDPRNSSRTCSVCGHCAKDNRKSQSKFHCLQCGFEANADYNAARNLKVRGECSDALLCRSEAIASNQAQAPAL